MADGGADESQMDGKQTGQIKWHEMDGKISSHLL